MKFFLLSTLLTLSTLILYATSSPLPQVPDFGITPTIYVKLAGPSDLNNEPSIQIFPLNSYLDIEWTSEGIKGDPMLSLQAYYIFPSTPTETYVPLLKNPEELYLSEKSFKLKLDSNLFEAEEKFYLVTITMKSNHEIVGTSEPFGVCDRCE